MDLSCIDVNLSIDNPQVCVKVPELKEGKVVKSSNVVYVAQAGKFCIVYKFQLKDGSYRAVRVWLKDLNSIKEILEDVSVVSKELRQLNSSYFVKYEYYENSILIKNQWRPLVVMEWCEGEDLKQYISTHINHPEDIKSLADKFLQMVMFFHEKGISHGDLQHKNIQITPQRNIVVVDYDSLCVPSNVGRREIIKGVSCFQHPIARENNKCLSPCTDYYSELVIYLSLILIYHHPEIWTKEISLNDNILLFTDDDINNINSNDSIFQKYRNETASDINMMIMTLQRWRNFEVDLAKLEPLEKVLDPWGCSGGHGGPVRGNQSKEEKSIQDIVGEMI